MGADATVPGRLIGLLVALAIGCSPGGDGSASRATDDSLHDPANRASDVQGGAGASSGPTSEDLPAGGQVRPPSLAGSAWSLRHTSTGQIIAEHQPEHLEARILPGSLAKVVTALAALDQGQADLRVVCPRRLTLQGRALDCVHPAQAAPFTLTAALAHSCNTFFTRLGARLDRAAWERLAVRLGVPAFGAPAPPELMAIGLAGPTASASAWRKVIVRVLSDASIPAAHRRVVRDALRAAARAGTASALDDGWSDTLAKTGTLVDAGRSEGVAVIVRPDEDLDLVVRVRGGAGRDAADLAASVFASHAPGARTVRQGVRRPGGVERVTLGIDAYVARVVGAEGAPDMPEAALDALAIAARTYAAAHPGRHEDEGFDLCDSTHCQATAARVWPAAARAAARTRGLVLAAGGRIVPVYYSAACSGRLQAAHAIWGGAPSGGEYVGAEPHPHPVPAWHADVTERALSAALREAGLTGGPLRDLRAGHDASTGLPRQVELAGFAPRQLSAHRFRTIVGRALGWDVLKSDAWTARRTAAGFRFEGRGKGHGVGLCVAGATAYAARTGASARTEDILTDYYPSLRIRSLGDTVRLRVTRASQGRADTLLRDVHAALVDLRRRLEFGAPRAIEVREHPTIEAYQRATGRAWWTGGSTRITTPTAARIDLPPLAALERAGSVELRLRHELVHALTASSLQEAPLWVHEGLAVHLAAAAATQAGALSADTAADTAAGWPTDAEMANPGGPEAMRAAYARAAACVARALAAGTPWRSIR